MVTLSSMQRFRFAFLILASLADWGICQLPPPIGERRITPLDEVASPFTWIRTHVDFGGAAHVFLVDTGTGVDTFDISLKSDVPLLNRLADRKSRFQSGATVPIHAGRLVSLGNSLINLEEIALMDLSIFTPIMGHKVSGLIGAPVVLKYGLGYDSVGKFYYIGISGIRKGFESVHPLSVTDPNIIYGSVKIDDHMIEDLLIDTGQNSELRLDTKHFDFFVDQGIICDLESAKVINFDGHSISRRGRLSSMELWGVKFENVPVMESSLNGIGLSMLSRFDFFIDGQNSSIWLSKSVDFSAPYITDRSGLSIALENEKIVVRGIRERSPAEKSGFAIGDILVSINSETLESNWKGLASARKQFSEYGPRSSTVSVR